MSREELLYRVLNHLHDHVLNGSKITMANPYSFCDLSTIIHVIVWELPLQETSYEAVIYTVHAIQTILYDKIQYDTINKERTSDF